MEIPHKHEGRLNDEPKESHDHVLATIKNVAISVHKIEIEDITNIQPNFKYPLIHRHRKDHTIFSKKLKKKIIKKKRLKKKYDGINVFSNLHLHLLFPMNKDIFSNHVLNSVCLGFNMFVSLKQKEHFKNVTRCYNINVENDFTQGIFHPIFPITNETSTLGKISFRFSQA